MRNSEGHGADISKKILGSWKAESRDLDGEELGESGGAREGRRRLAKGIHCDGSDWWMPKSQNLDDPGTKSSWIPGDSV